jgi:acetyl esterase/lipase
MRIALLLLLAAFSAQAQPIPKYDWQPLWPGPAPGAKGTEPTDIPAISIYKPARPNGQAVVIFPGGGYGALALDHEGFMCAEWLTSQGVTAIVTRYRLGSRGYRHPVMLNDAKRAVRSIRSRAAALGIDPARIGVWGFSAGGHLASTISTHFDAGDPNAADPVDRVSSRPDFAILGYPVVTFTEAWTHQGSKRNLLGENPPANLVDDLSNEKRVTAKTPATFLFHTNEDKGVPPENSVYYYLALRKAGVPAELHIYERGPHGVGLAPTDIALSSWPARLSDWLRNR